MPHHMLEDDDLQHLFGLVMGKLTVVDEGGDVGVQGVGAFSRQLEHIQE